MRAAARAVVWSVARAVALAQGRGQQSNKPRNTPGERTANCDNKGKRTSRRLAARRHARRVTLGVRPRVRSWCVPPPRRRTGARVERRSGARGATDGTREEARRRRRRARSARTPLFDCGDEEPPATNARRARRARVTRRSARAAPSARSGDRREDARQGQRAATGREERDRWKFNDRDERRGTTRMRGGGGAHFTVRSARKDRRPTRGEMIHTTHSLRALLGCGGESRQTA